ncbi:Mu transposase C-terminal domain-containing protein [Bradyrhizobium diazoefficiens]|nr:hypothetical protein XF15B_24230 [Bradyrhizobium diazoefficiens]
MRKFITDIIERIGRFIGRRPSAETDPMPRAVDGEAGIRIPPGRLDTAVLTKAGILLNGIRYQSAALAELPLKSGSHRRIAIKWNPDDASQIQVLDRALPGEIKWITVQAADIPGEMSFAEHARVREFAKTHDLAFSTESERAEAFERLKRHWEKLAGRPSVRARRIASEWNGPVGDEVDIIDLPSESIMETPLAPKARLCGRKSDKAAVLKAKRTKTRKATEAKAKAPTRTSRTKRK